MESTRGSAKLYFVRRKEIAGLLAWLLFSVSFAAEAQRPPNAAEQAEAEARAKMAAAHAKAVLTAATEAVELDIKSAYKFTADYFADSEKKLDGPYAGSLVARVEFLDWSKKALADVKALKAADPAAAVDPINRLVTRLNEINAIVEADKTCRASQACLDARWAKKTESIACSTIASRKLAAQQMALEKANPSGVVDLRRLHDLGQAIQDMDAQ